MRSDADRLHAVKRERLLNAIEFKPTDRLPVQGWGGTIAAIQRVTGRHDYLAHPREVFTQAMRAWDVDVLLQFVLPDRQDRQCGPVAQVRVGDGLLSVLYGLLGDWREEHGAWKSPEDYRDFCESLPPAAEAKRFVDADVTYRRWLELNAWGEFLKPIVWVPGHLCGTVGWMWYGTVGYENYLMAHVLYPEAAERLFAFLGEEGRLRNMAIARAIRDHGLIPVVYSGEDICGNDGPLVAPQLLRDTYFPHLKRAVEPLIDAGIHWLWHSDGNILPILPDLLACGFDGFQGFEEDKGMDLPKLAATPCRNGRLPFLCGSISVTTTFYQPPETVRADVQRMLSLAQQRHGGVILSPSSTILENAPMESVLAFYEAAAVQRLEEAVCPL
jgi:hypothetical protein